MRENVKKQIRNAKKRRIRRRRFYAAVALCSILVAGIVSWKLILPGTAMSGETYCGKEEHTHSDACYEQVLVCGQEEGVGAHTHTDACYTEVRTDQLICGQEESAGHVHTDACYTNELTCGQEENAEHTHTDACYTKTLTCGQEEGAGAHTHTDACYATERKLTCGQEEGAGHTHTDACYKTELTCGKEEHKHTSECYSNPDAVETEDQWKAAFKNYKLTGEWGKDTAAIAKSQVGYKESAENYKVNEDKSTDGYTRYADWAGDDIYGDWNTDFAAFCLNYGGVPADKFPVNADDLDAWITAMNNAGYYGNPDSAEPQTGNLIVLKKADQDNKQTVGIVSEVKTDKDGNATKVKVIEGDCDDEVKENTYAADSSEIVGYGLVNEAYGDVYGSENLDIQNSVKDQENQEENDSVVADNDISKVKPKRAAALYSDNEENVSEADNEDNSNASPIDMTSYLTHVSVSVLRDNTWTPVTEVTDGDNVQVRLEFDIDANVVTTDTNTLTYKVPSEFTPNDVLDGKVTQKQNDQDVVVGDFLIQTDGTITITLNDEFATGEEFSGYLQFFGTAHANGDNTSGEVNFGGDTETITVKKDESSDIYDMTTEKSSGEPQKTQNGWAINYTITVSSEKGTEGNVKIQDWLGEVTGGSAAYDETSFSIKHYIGDTEDNDFSEPSPSISDQENTFNYANLPQLKAGEKYVVTYTVLLTESAGGDGYVKIGNTVGSYSGDHQQKWDYDEKIVSESLIDKYGYYDSERGQIKWTIEAKTDGNETHTVKDIIPTEPKGIQIVGNVTVTGPNNTSETIDGTTFSREGYTILKGPSGTYKFEFYTNAPAGGAGTSFSVTNGVDVDNGKYSDEYTVTATQRDWDVNKNSGGDTTDNGMTYHSWNAAVDIPYSNQLSEFTYTDEILDPEITGAGGTAKHYGIASRLDQELKSGIKFTALNSNQNQVSYGFDAKDSPVIITIKYFDENNREVDPNNSETEIKKFTITVAPKEGQTVYGVKLETGNYSTVVDLTDVEEGSTIIFKNSASIPQDEDTAEYTTEKKKSVEKFAAVPNGENLTGGYYQPNLTADYNAENGIIWYRVVYRTSAGENEDLTLTDKIPAGMTYVDDSLTASYTNDNLNSYWPGEGFNSYGQNIEYRIAEKIQKESLVDNVLTVKIPGGYNGLKEDGSISDKVLGAPRTLAIFYALKYTDDERWKDVMTSQVQYENSVTIGNHPSSSSTTTVNREEKDVIQKSSEQMTIEQGGQEYWVDSFKYYVVINPDARDLEPNLDYLTLTDTITSDTVNRLTLDLGETHLYELDPTKEDDHYIGSEVDKDRYNLTYDYTTNTMEVRIPDSFACVLVYTYHVDRGTFGESTLTNTVDLMGRWSDQQDDKVKVNGAEAGVSRAGRMTIYKVDGDDYNKRLPGATFTLTEYDREAEGDQKWIVPAVTEKNKQSKKWDDNVFTTDENGTITFTGTKNDPTLDRLTVYRMYETGKPEGYENATPVTFYFVLLGDGIEKVGDIEYNTSTKEGAIQYMEANGIITGDEPFLDNISFFGNDAYTDVYLENTNNSLTVKKIWQNSNGEEITGTNPVELEIYGATLGQDGCVVTFNGKAGNSEDSQYNYTETKVLKKGTTFHIVIRDDYIQEHSHYTLYVNDQPKEDVFYPVTANGESNRIAFDLTIPDDAARLKVDLVYYSDYWCGEKIEFSGVTADHIYTADDLPTYKITLGVSEQDETISSDKKIVKTSAWSYTINNIQSLDQDKFWIVKEVTTGNWTTVYQNNQSQTGEIKVYNQLTEQYELPETGGIGTKVYIAGGTILMMSSCLLGGYRMRRKRERRRR